MPKIIYPIDPYTTGDFLKFGQTIRRRIILWATHLGDDVDAPAGTEVKAVAPGEVVWSEIRPGSEEKRNWGGVIIVDHGNFHAVYGHMSNLKFNIDDEVSQGDTLGVIAPSYTSENGYWKHPHLHFAIYTGPWNDEILPGYWRPEHPFRTKLKYWHNPQEFIKNHQQLL